MVASERTLTFYFDFISPYAYLGWKQIHDLGAEHGVPVVSQPVLLAALLNEWGHKGPAEIGPKREYTWKHVVRLAHDLNIDVALPPAHPFNPLLPLRLASLPLPDETRHRMIDRLFEMAWRTGEGTTDKTVVADALTDLGLDGPDLVSQTQAEATKRKLEVDSRRAIQVGVFGVPTVVVDDELFWGQDSFPHLARFLRAQDPVSPGSIEAWRKLPATAHRR